MLAIVTVAVCTLVLLNFPAAKTGQGAFLLATGVVLVLFFLFTVAKNGHTDGTMSKVADVAGIIGFVLVCWQTITASSEGVPSPAGTPKAQSPSSPATTGSAAVRRDSGVAAVRR